MSLASLFPTLLLLVLSPQEDVSLVKADSLRKEGLVQKKRGQFDIAIRFYLQSRAFYEEADDIHGLADISNKLAVCYFYLRDFEKCISYFQTSLDMFDQLKDPIGKANVQIGLANYYLQETHEFQKAYILYQESLEAYVRSDHPSRSKMAMIISNNLGNVFCQEHPENSLFNLDSALTHYKKAISINENTLKDTLRQGGFLLNMAEVMTQIDKNLAIEYYDQASHFFELIDNPYKLSNVYLNKGYFLLNESKLDGALKESKAAFQIAFQHGYWEIVQSSAGNLAKIFELKGRPDSSLHYLKLYVTYNDYIYNQNKIEEIENLKIRYQTEKKDRLIELKQAQIDLTVAERNSLLITLLISLVFTVIIVILNKKRRKVLEALNQKKQQLHEQEVNQLLHDQELKSINAMLEGEEKERGRIARDLHDRIGSLVSAMKLQTDSNSPKLNGLLDETAEEVRRISHNLETKVLNRFGLVAALEDLADKIRGTEKIVFELTHINIDERMDSAYEIHIYRIVQELISNALKHSQASEIITQVNRLENQLLISVEDDGIGFNSLSMKKSGGMGLKNVHARTEELNGSFNVDSGKGAGTIITIEIPL